MEKKIKELADKYHLPVDFVLDLYNKIEDKENFARAVKMFDNGTLAFDIATGQGTINIASIRHDIAVRRLQHRKKIQEEAKHNTILLDSLFGKRIRYYNGFFSSTTTIVIESFEISTGTSVVTFKASDGKELTLPLAVLPELCKKKKIPIREMVKGISVTSSYQIL